MQFTEKEKLVEGDSQINNWYELFFGDQKE